MSNRWSTPHLQQQPGMPQPQPVQAGKNVRDFRDAPQTPEDAQLSTDMPELVASLLAQKQAGGELTGMDAQLMQAAKLRDKEYNENGEFTTGGIGAAMGGMANYLDRQRGGAEHDRLSGEMDVARQKIATGEAKEQERLLKKSLREENRLIEQTAYDRDQDQLDRDETAAATAEDRRRWEAEYALEVGEADNAAGYGEKLGSKQYTDLGKDAQAALDLANLLDEGEADPSLYRQLNIRDDGTPMEQAIGALGTTDMIQNLAGTVSQNAPGFAATLASPFSDDPEGAVQRSQAAKDFANRRELVYEGILRYERAGGAVPAAEMTKVREAIGIARGEDPESAKKAMSFLSNWANQKVMNRARKSNMSKSQFENLRKTLTENVDPDTGETSQGRFAYNNESGQYYMPNAKRYAERESTQVPADTSVESEIEQLQREIAEEEAQLMMQGGRG